MRGIFDSEMEWKGLWTDAADEFLDKGGVSQQEFDREKAKLRGP
jgi:hypothetical protein